MSRAARYARPRFRTQTVNGIRVVVTTVSDIPIYRVKAERILGGPVDRHSRRQPRHYLRPEPSMTHYCPSCHGRMSSNPADIHVCVLTPSPSQVAPPPNPTDRRPGPPPPLSLRLRDALISGFCHTVWTAAFVTLAYLIVWADPPY